MPNMDLERVYTTPESGIRQGTSVMFVAQSQNNGVTGYFKTNFQIYNPSGTLMTSYAFNTRADTGTEPSTYWTYTIPSSWADGRYTFTATITNCSSPSTCQRSMIFNVGTVTCTASTRCDGSYLVTTNTDCTETRTLCVSGCSSGRCSGPDVYIYAFTLQNTSYREQYSYLPGARMIFTPSIKSRNGVSGSYNAYYKIYQGSTVVASNSASRTAPAIGGGDNPSWTHTIPTTWSGTYTAEMKVDQCTSGCSWNRTFTVGTPCTDADGDGYFTSCTPLDCNDANRNINPGAVEVCGNTVDENCDGSAPACVPTAANFSLLSVSTKLASGVAKTTFLTTDRIMLVDRIQNYGAAGNYTCYFDVYNSSGTNVWPTTSTAYRAPGSAVDVFALFEIPDEWRGTYTFTGRVTPCSPSTNCQKSTTFVVNRGCIAQYTCQNLTHRAYQNTDCSISWPTACTAGRACSAGTCVACTASMCGANARCSTTGPGCLCNANYANADGNWSNGCEVNLLTDTANCGRVGNVCGPFQRCTSGTCTDLCTPSMCGANAGCSGGGCACNADYANVDGIWDNGCEIDLMSNPDNCGTTGNACSSDERCVSGVCEIMDFSSMMGKGIIMDPIFFEEIVTALTAAGRVNMYFFENESERDAETLAGAVAVSLKNDSLDLAEIASDVSDFLGYPIDIAVHNDLIGDHFFMQAVRSGEYAIIEIDGPTDFIFVTDKRAGASIAEAEGLAGNANKVLTAGNYIASGAFAVLFAWDHTSGGGDVDVPKFAVYAGANFLAYGVLPHMAVAQFIKVTKDFAFAVVGLDPSQITCDITSLNPADQAVCTFWLANGVIDTLTDAELLADTIDGECGIMNGQFPVCVEGIGQGLQLFSHPIPLINDVTYTISGDRARFTVDIEDYNLFDAPFDSIWVGATIECEGSEGCNYDLPPQATTFSFKEQKEMVFDWDIPETFLRERNVTFVVKVWYNCLECTSDARDMYEAACMGDGVTPDVIMCDYLTRCTASALYTQCNPSDDNAYRCYGDNLDQMHYALAVEKVGFRVRNEVPIINNVRCDSPTLLGVDCPSTINLNAGDRLVMTLYANDIDGDHLETSSAGSVGTTKECTSAEGYDAICDFTLQTDESMAGEQWLRLNVMDGYNLTSRIYTINVLGTTPPTPPAPTYNITLVAPTAGASLVYGTQTFRWNQVSGVTYYYLNLYNAVTGAYYSSMPTAASTYCSGGLCQRAYAPARGSYLWNVTDAGWWTTGVRRWSETRRFSIV
jgi:hypothetical protein